MDEKNMSVPDPILQKAAQEITEICKKYSIGGYVILASRTHGEYILYFPEWSKAQLETTGIRFKSKKGLGREEVRDTVHMIQVFEAQGRNLQMGMENLLESLESKMFISGGPKRIDTGN